MNAETTTTLLFAFASALLFGLGAVLVAWFNRKPPVGHIPRHL